MDWSPEQQQAINTRKKNLLVAAAAGSGKTSVLVERIIKQVLEEKVDIDHLLIVTFTNAAAQEMRARIGQRLAEAIAARPSSQRLTKQLALLSATSISTIHAFCQKIIRHNFATIHLDPRFRMAGPQEAELLRQDALETLFATKYEQGDEDFLALANAYGTDRGDDVLQSMVLRLYEFSMSQPFPEQWLRSLASRFQLEKNVDIFALPWIRPLCRAMYCDFSRALDAIERALMFAEEIGANFYVMSLQQDRIHLETLRHLLVERDWEGLRLEMAKPFARLRAPRDTEEEIKQLTKQERDRAKKIIAHVQQHFFQESAQNLIDNIRALTPTVETLVQLTLDFATTFAAKKREREVVDFHDLEHFALDILRVKKDDTDALEPSPVALALREKYVEVMVDEYQDTNSAQEAILSLVSRGQNLFTVGDVKQSIYRFRLADPMLFQEKYKTYPTLGEHYARINLSKNYRSRLEILTAVNFIFRNLMRESSMELAYDEAAELRQGFPYANTSLKNLAGPIEVTLIDRDAEAEQEDLPKSGMQDAQKDAQKLSDAENEEAEELEGFAVEAAYLAQRVRKMMQAGLYVWDKDLLDGDYRGAYRPLHYRDMVVLLRSTVGKAEILLEAFRAADVPAYAALDGGYFEETEVRRMIALLSVIDNIRQDIPLAATLTSPLGGFTAEDLAKLRVLMPEGDLFTALQAAKEQGEENLQRKVTAFLDNIKRWRALSRRLSVSELVWQIYRDTGYYAYAGAMPGGLLRQANLRMLSDRAEAFEKTNDRGLFRFLRFIERMRRQQTDLSSARTLGEGEDVVRVMSIHRSKGLEFPVVFLADIGKAFNLKDAQEHFLIHKDLGLGLWRVDAKQRVTYPTLAYEGIRQRILEESKAEELRILYVAMTRAKEKLVLTGSAKDLAKQAQNWTRFWDSANRPMPAWVSLEARSFLDWVMTALARHKDGGAIRALAGLAKGYSQTFTEQQEHTFRIQIVPATAIKGAHPQALQAEEILQHLQSRTPLPSTPAKAVIEQRFQWHYDERGVRNVPAKLSVTEIKRRFTLEDHTFVPLPNQRKKNPIQRPHFLQRATKLTATEFGILMHAVFQHVNLQGDLTVEGVRKQIQQMTEKGILLPEDTARVEVQPIANFFASTLGQRLIKARKVWRELPFSRLLNANRLYPEAEPAARIFTQGMMDVLFEEADGALILLDYKTDHDRDENRLRAKYLMQMQLYTEAAETIVGRRLKEKYLTLLRYGTTVQM